MPAIARVAGHQPERTVEAGGRAQVFQKLGLDGESPDLNRRVLAVLTLLRA